jgi:hypothetical protein
MNGKLAMVVFALCGVIVPSASSQPHDFSVCLLREDTLAILPARYDRRTGDTIVQGQTLERWERLESYAARSQWYQSNEELSMFGRKYRKVGFPGVVQADQLYSLTSYRAIPVFGTPLEENSIPNQLFVPIRAGCQFQLYAPVEPPLSAPALAARLDVAFVSASMEFDVPSELLSAIGFVETQWQPVWGDSTDETPLPAFGYMGLAGIQLERGAGLANVSVDLAKTNMRENIRAAAALLDHYADSLQIQRSELDAWRPVVAVFSMIEDKDLQDRYVDESVYGTLRNGAFLFGAGEDSVMFLPPVIPSEIVEEVDTLSPNFLPEGTDEALVFTDPDHPGSRWLASEFYGARPAPPPGAVAIVVIHTCGGDYVGCIEELRRSSRRVSAHYLVKEDGREVTQLVLERNRANHTRASYRCSYNGNYMCSHNGMSTNDFSIGIEHAGHASQARFSPQQIETSAILACAIARRNGFSSIEHVRFVGHGQLQEDREDPGRAWPWDRYVARVAQLCGAPHPQPGPARILARDRTRP